MRIWYQSYSQIGFDPRWKKYEDDLEAYVKKVARPDTQVFIHGVEKHAPKMTYSNYIQYMHISQLLDNALQAEREGFDAFCIGGALDLGHVYLKELLDIPVACISESSFYHACLLADKFGIVSHGQNLIQKMIELINYHGLSSRFAGWADNEIHWADLLDLFERNPEGAISMFADAARKVIAQGAGAIVPGFGGWHSFLGQQGVYQVDGVPIVNGVMVVIKTAEMLVDMNKLGIKRSRGPLAPSKEEMMAARKIYGFDN
jgi:allantoin racemase